MQTCLSSLLYRMQYICGGHSRLRVDELRCTDAFVGWKDVSAG